MPDAKCRAERRAQLSQRGKDCNAPLEVLLFSASDGKAELIEVGAGAGLSEDNQGSEDITPYKVANIMLHTSDFASLHFMAFVWSRYVEGDSKILVFHDVPSYFKISKIWGYCFSKMH